MTSSCSWRDGDDLLVKSQAARSPDKSSVVLLATTQAHISFAANLLESLRRLGIYHAVLVTPDESLLAHCIERGWSCTLNPHLYKEIPLPDNTTNPGAARARNGEEAPTEASRQLANARRKKNSRASAANSSALPQHSKRYNRFTWARIGWIECVVLLGVSVLFLDTDSVALSHFGPATSGLFSSSAALTPLLPVLAASPVTRGDSRFNMSRSWGSDIVSDGSGRLTSTATDSLINPEWSSNQTVVSPLGSSSRPSPPPASPRPFPPRLLSSTRHGGWGRGLLSVRPGTAPSVLHGSPSPAQEVEEEEKAEEVSGRLVAVGEQRPASEINDENNKPLATRREGGALRTRKKQRRHPAHDQGFGGNLMGANPREMTGGGGGGRRDQTDAASSRDQFAAGPLPLNGGDAGEGGGSRRRQEKRDTKAGVSAEKRGGGGGGGGGGGAAAGVPTNWDLSVSCDNLSGPQTNPALSAWRAGPGALAVLRSWRALEPQDGRYGDMRGLKNLLRGRVGGPGWYFSSSSSTSPSTAASVPPPLRRAASSSSEESAGSGLADSPLFEPRNQNQKQQQQEIAGGVTLFFRNSTVGALKRYGTPLKVRGRSRGGVEGEEEKEEEEEEDVEEEEEEGEEEKAPPVWGLVTLVQPPPPLPLSSMRAELSTTTTTSPEGRVVTSVRAPAGGTSLSLPTNDSSAAITAVIGGSGVSTRRQPPSAVTVHWRCLELDEFCNCGGKRQKGIRRGSEKCVWIHANCLASSAKVPMLRKAGLWVVNEEPN